MRRGCEPVWLEAPASSPSERRFSFQNQHLVPVRDSKQALRATRNQASCHSRLNREQFFPNWTCSFSIMVTRQEIEDFASEIARLYHPEKIILFGSQARGDANEDSDVDMLVVMDYEGRAAYKEAEISASINPPFPLDLVVRRSAEVAYRLKQNDCFLKEAVEEGKIMYGPAATGLAR